MTLTVTQTTTLGGRLRTARLFAGIEQTDLADTLGVSRGTISNYERGVSTLPALVMIQWADITRVALGWIAYGLVRPEGFEPPTYWSGVNLDSEIDTAVSMMRTHIVRDLDYATAEDRTISALWRVVYGLEGEAAGGSLVMFDKMWGLIFELAAEEVQAGGEWARDDLTCSQCRGGVTFDSDGNRWCGVCEPDADEMYQAEHDFTHRADISDPPAGTAATVARVHRGGSSVAGLSSWGSAVSIQGLDTRARNLSEINS